MNARTSSLLIAVLVFLGGPWTALAQTGPSRLEIGAQASFLRLSDFGSTSAGLGGRVTFDLTTWAAIEAEADFFPNDDIVFQPANLSSDFRLSYQRKRADGFVGVKLGMRTDKVGVFAKVRPGFTSLTDNGGPGCTGEVCALILLMRPEYRTEFAFDLGGVLEFYPSVRTVVRFDLGDTMIRHRSLAVPPCFSGGCTSHNLSSGMGVGMRF
jgi:hypothetical protein